MQRLMHGEFKVEDLTTIFLALRDRAGGREPIIEIGAFVAHREERNKGFVTRAVRDFFVRIRFWIEVHNKAPKTYDLPPYTAEYLEAAARRMDYKAVTKGSRFTRAYVSRSLPSLLACVRASKGRNYLWPSVSTDDLDLFDFLAGNITIKPLFDEDRLFKDLCDALIENGLLRPNERPSMLPLKGTVALFALTHMHQCVVNLSDGATGQLEASPYGGGSDKIAVVATVPALDSKGVSVAHAVFLTNRTTEDCAAGALHNNDPQNPVWRFPLELGPDKKLRPLES